MAGIHGPGARLPVDGTVTNGRVCFSFILKVTDLTGLNREGGTVAGFNLAIGPQPNLPATLGARVSVRAAVGGGYNLGLSKASDLGQDFVWDPREWDDTDVVHVVGEYAFGMGGPNDDTARLWLNPPSGTFGATHPPPPSVTSDAGNDLAQVASFVLLQRGGGALPAFSLVDELRLGDTWASVTPPPPPLDFGDAPDPLYPTLLPDGARHQLSDLLLGARIDAEGNGQPTNQDDLLGGPDDEDGVTFSPLVVGAPATVTITASAPGFIDAWIDFDGGGWTAAEQILTRQAHPGGTRAFPFAVPTTAVVGRTWARVRLSRVGGLTPVGYAADGEVEDHRVRLQAPPSPSTRICGCRRCKPGSSSRCSTGFTIVRWREQSACGSAAGDIMAVTSCRTGLRATWSCR